MAPTNVRYASAPPVRGLKARTAHSFLNDPSASNSSPPNSISNAAAARTFSSRAWRRAYVEPSAHPTHASCAATTPPQKLPSASIHVNLGPHQHHDPGETNQQPNHMARRQRIAVGHQ